MSDYDVGYGKPPAASRFKRGASGNPKGRPKRQSLGVGEVIKSVLSEPVQYREGGRTKKAARHELALKRHLKRALEGDVGSAAALLKLRAQAERRGGTSGLKVQIIDWLPEHPKETAAEKMRDFGPGGPGRESEVVEALMLIRLRGLRAARH